MKREKKLLTENLLFAFLIILPLWMVKGAETIFGWDLYFLGNYPRSLENIYGIITGIFAHGDYQHLFNNTVPLFITSFVLFSSYRKVAFKVLLGVVLLSGFWVFVAARPSYHIGASGVVYGMVAFLFFMGVFRKERRAISISLLIAFLYGSLIWGIFPHNPSISWEGHMLGAIAGLFMAVVYYRVDYHPETIRYMARDDGETDLPYWKYNVEGELKEPFRKAKKQRSLVYRYLYRDSEKGNAPGDNQSTRPSNDTTAR